MTGQKIRTMKKSLNRVLLVGYLLLLMPSATWAHSFCAQFYKSRDLHSSLPFELNSELQNDMNMVNPRPRIETDHQELLWIMGQSKVSYGLE